ncbi:hypothetical protein CALVIDRAFT_601808 [Calocera viscosa TUFC12733]|uniref:Uncharacterized protein n=1 Tax=Calocera viscosa (strain TUFC12733) TaxID=1330018 RepID=A0A167HTS0_CALVF|nr:hypothetical protein CALVIDRAFT_601808 [Calocera viscosa TUFC12733]
MRRSNCKGRNLGALQSTTNTPRLPGIATLSRLAASQSRYQYKGCPNPSQRIPPTRPSFSSHTSDSAQHPPNTEKIINAYEADQERIVNVLPRTLGQTFSFLDENTIRVAGTDSGALEICTIPSLSASSPPNSDASTSTSPGSARSPPQLMKRVRLLLALRPSNVTTRSILARSDPPPAEGPFGLWKMPEPGRGVCTSAGASASASAYGSPTPGGASSSTPRAGSPNEEEGTWEKAEESELFYPSPSARLLTISLTLDSSPDTVPNLRIFVLFSTLLATLRLPEQFLPSPSLSAPRSRALQAHYDPSSILILPWPTWSSHARASTKPHEPHGYVCYTHGYSYITSSPFISAHLHGQAQQAGLAGLVAADALEGLFCTKVEVWDFNPANGAEGQVGAGAGAEGQAQAGWTTRRRGRSLARPGGEDGGRGGGQWAELAQLVEEGVQEWLDTDEEEEEEEEDGFEDMADDSGNELPAGADQAAPAAQGVQAQLVPVPAAPRLPAIEQLLLAPTTLPAQDVFVHPVHSGLAAVVMSLEVPGLLSGLTIDGERIIMLIQRGGREMLKGHVF